jgi:hypothetical protein
LATRISASDATVQQAKRVVQEHANVRGLVEKTALESASPSEAATKLKALVLEGDLWGGSHGVSSERPVEGGISTLPRANDARDSAVVLERRLESTLRALRREAGGRNAPAAVRVLSQDALRLLIESMATKQLATLLDAGTAKGPHALRGGPAQTASLLATLLSSKRPDRHREMAALLLASPGAKSRPASQEPLSDAQQRALADILTTMDPSHGAFVREKLQSGASVDEVRHLLTERLVPIALEDKNAVEEPAVKPAGLKFDLGINKWVQNDRSWRYDVRLSQLFEYVVDGIIDGREELTARLVSSSMDPETGTALLDDKTVAKFVDDLAAALHSDDASVRALLDQHFDMIFSTTDGGDLPVAALWELPVRLVADLFAAMTDPAFTDKLGTIADRARTADVQRKDEALKPLEALRAKYPGVPRRHKRAHAALINMGLANQSVAEMGRAGGVLPRETTLLDPKILKEKYANTEDLKMRFLITDEGEMFVLSDEDFEAVVKKWGFPPNHELLSYNRPIMGSGYVKIDHGRITALEDDVVMLKGKLPEGLPPALEILRARGFALDEAGIEKSSHVLDFEAFQKLTTSTELPKAPTGSPADINSVLKNAPHEDRPVLCLAVVKDALARELASGKTDSAARAAAGAFVAEALGGLHIINTSRKDFREGRLPNNLNESSDIQVDASIATYLLALVTP